MKLMSCPFCGSTKAAAVAEPPLSSQFLTRVHCGECWATGPTATDEADAIEQWNEATVRIERDLALRDAARLGESMVTMREEITHLRAQLVTMQQGGRL